MRKILSSGDDNIFCLTCEQVGTTNNYVVIFILWRIKFRHMEVKKLNAGNLMRCMPDVSKMKRCLVEISISLTKSIDTVATFLR